MAVTLTVGNSLVFVSTIIKNQRLNVNNMEPGLTAANTVLQLMLGSPFIYRFNRKRLQFTIAKGSGQDYAMALPTLGRIETQWLTDASNKIHAMEGSQSLAKASTVRKPMKAAPQYDDNEGNITFRFDSIPDLSYTANFDFQQKAPLLTSYASSFGPVPDEFGFLYNKLMLAECGVLVNDSRFNIWRAEGLAGLLATQDGLDAQAKAIFYEQMLNTGRTSMRSQMAGQAGAQGARV